MEKPRFPSFLSSIRKRVSTNHTVKFLLFMEDNPKHKVMEDIDPVVLAFLPVAILLLGIAGQVIFSYFTIFGFLLYYVGVLIVILESLHFTFDK